MSKHFDRPIMIDINKDGTISIRERNFSPVSGGVPVFSVATIEEAQGLRTYLCTEQDEPCPSMPNERWFRLDEFAGNVDDLPAVTLMFDRAYSHLYAKPSLAA